ncbi:MAG: hypothetical protein FWG45_03835 [Oscillospiraceae bacterium]|nr:hypothetical protein [Oscillospiraceae bacterium]
MPTNKNADLKQTYFDLLVLKYRNANTVVVGLDEMILRQSATMDAEDVSYVDKKFNDFVNSQKK